ncbi:phage tail assembly chaperone [soil metagenome]
MLRLAIGWGLDPEAFWRLSLCEWRMLTEGGADPALAREDFNRLAEIFPDE